MKKVYVKRESVKSIRNGAPAFSSDLLKVQPAIKSGETIGIFFGKKLIALGIAKVSSNGMKKTRGSVVRVDRVI